jgi:hypothetical protein
MTSAVSTWWTVGWVVGGVVILLVAVLILAITALARRVDGTAVHLVSDLDSIAHKTRPLQAVGATNVAVQTITACLRRARGEQPAQNKYRTSPGWRE